MNTLSTAAVGVFGASGYAGRELVRLISRHPRLQLAFATSRMQDGDANGDGEFIHPDAAPVGECDLVFSCLPHGDSAQRLDGLSDRGIRVIDLSDDLRVERDGMPAWQRAAVYGLPELHRAEIRGSTVVANPGCYPTAAILALAPALRAGWVGERVIINAASGVTGAGRTARRELLFGEVAEDYRAYGLGNEHRHLAEMRDQIGRLGGSEAPELVFTPHLLPVRRGILATMYVPLREEMPVERAWGLWMDAYSSEPMVTVVRDRIPSLSDVVGTNQVMIGLAMTAGVKSPLLTIVAALDNLVKGAAGQAIQNMNLMFGWDETMGLPC